MRWRAAYLVLTCRHTLGEPTWTEPIRRGVVWPPGDPHPVEELCGCARCGAMWLRGMNDDGVLIFAPQGPIPKVGDTL